MTGEILKQHPNNSVFSHYSAQMGTMIEILTFEFNYFREKQSSRAD